MILRSKRRVRGPWGRTGPVVRGLSALSRAVGVVWRRSLQLRVVVLTLGLSLAVILVLGFVLTSQITNRVLDVKVHAATEEIDSRPPTPSLNAREATFSLPPTLTRAISAPGTARSSCAAAWITQSAPDIPSRIEALSVTSPGQRVAPTPSSSAALAGVRTSANTSCPSETSRRRSRRTSTPEPSDRS